jgi:hypothetical protein
MWGAEAHGREAEGTQGRGLMQVMKPYIGSAISGLLNERDRPRLGLAWLWPLRPTPP